MAEPPERRRALVVDAPVAVKWYLQDEEDSDLAAELLARFDRGEFDLLAPYHVRYAVASAITTATLGREPRLSHEEGQTAVAEFLASGIQTLADPDIIATAFTLVHQHGCAFYDALYLALSQILGIPFITADRKFFQRLGHLPDVVWLADFPAASPEP